MFAEYFKALGEPTRLRIIKLLSEKELCVCELEQIMRISQPRISQHLKILKQTGLVCERREGQRRICRVDYDKAEALLNEFRQFLYQPMQEMKDFEEDYIRLGNLQRDMDDKKIKN
ncbi:MAG TPA: metalloregulator ArsR/SmtB family transcription factor [Syntrophomonadaceae bacterium]|nr:metalloregulator ArsR/SmtB family transcription factor [Syntrophomonadaceae bacterium]HQD91437.1 metalloregulator ArsR/SmtB family transcription factor [Syntrophomonadaceae bacterium]